jgi:hypothetical protein
MMRGAPGPESTVGQSGKEPVKSPLKGWKGATLRPYTKAPVIVDPGYNWTGFYAGLNIGYSWGRSSSTLSFIDSTSGAILNANAVKFDMNGHRRWPDRL